MIRLWIIGLALLTANCAYNKMQYGTEGISQNEKGEHKLEGRVVWLKNKKNAADVLVMLRNDYKHPVVIKLNDFQLDIEGETAALINQGTITELTPGQTSEQLLKFRFASVKERAGTAKITLAKIFEGPIESMGKKPLPPLTLQVPVAAH
jgi:hypothetical protein